MFLVKWNVICFNDAKLRWKNEIGNRSKIGGEKLENKEISKWENEKMRELGASYNKSGGGGD